MVVSTLPGGTMLQSSARNEEFVMSTSKATVRWQLVRAFGSNPLVRIIDRIEAAAMMLAIVVSLAAMPVSNAIGTAVHDQRSRVYAEEAQSRHMVPATVMRQKTAISHPWMAVIRVDARWRADNADHTGVFSWARPVEHGHTIGIWVDQHGNRVGPPTSRWLAVADAVAAGVGLWIVVTAAAAVLFAILRSLLDRRRYAAWDRDITSLADGGGRTNHRS